MIHKLDLESGGRILSLETGKVAKQADGAVTVRYGDTVVLVTAVASDEVSEEQDFFPLQVEYREPSYAAGRIPGGFFKREGRPREKEILSARLIDRPLRPLFPESFRHEVQIVAMVLSSDQENDSDVLAMIGASAALGISDIPFFGPIGAVRIGKLNGEFVVNPTFTQLDISLLDLTVAGTAESITMVEGGAKEISEEEILKALSLAQQEIQKIVKIQEELISVCGKPKRGIVPEIVIPELVKAVEELTLEEIRIANTLPAKEQRQTAIRSIIEKANTFLKEKFPEQEGKIKEIVEEIQKRDLRRMILEEGKRADGRNLSEIRLISCEVGVLPRTHGSALFSRGETQSLAVTTLGTASDEQIVEDLEGESSKSYMLHYNFPPFSVGEVRPIRGPGRREIGHGALAERAVAPVIPSEDVFPYTIRVVSDILESNGSSSMASVCGASLSLMDAGVPIKSNVAGIAMGLVVEDEKVAILSDIMGLEDHLGDMDFKIAGTKEGITALQLDIKIKGLKLEILRKALEQAHTGRMHILETMERTLAKPRDELSIYAPRIISIMIPKDKIGDVIGPGGKVIRAIQEETGTKIEIEDDGKVTIAGVGGEGTKKALRKIEELTAVPEVGKIYRGKVKRLTSFGAFVEFLSGQEGLVHISELERRRVERVEDVIKEGEEVLVKLIKIDEQGRYNLSRKQALG
ncbi:MAG: polyribonucleotide nucleotidyltransferase [Candidatus Edwardsbacteria bacterium]